jgi:branched-chain amino acid transport system substrate-binding protein
MRAADHQLLNPLFISTIVKTATRAGNPQSGGDKLARYDVEDSGMGFKTDARVEAYVAAQPTSCQMKRP